MVHVAYHAGPNQPWHNSQVCVGCAPAIKENLGEHHPGDTPP